MSGTLADLFGYEPSIEKLTPFGQILMKLYESDGFSPFIEGDTPDNALLALDITSRLQAMIIAPPGDEADLMATLLTETDSDQPIADLVKKIIKTIHSEVLKAESDLKVTLYQDYKAGQSHADNIQHTSHADFKVRIQLDLEVKRLEEKSKPLGFLILQAGGIDQLATNLWINCVVEEIADTLIAELTNWPKSSHQQVRAIITEIEKMPTKLPKHWLEAATLLDSKGGNLAGSIQDEIQNQIEAAFEHLKSLVQEFAYTQAELEKALINKHVPSALKPALRLLSTQAGNDAALAAHAIKRFAIAAAKATPDSSAAPQAGAGAGRAARESAQDTQRLPAPPPEAVAAVQADLRGWGESKAPEVGAKPPTVPNQRVATLWKELGTNEVSPDLRGLPAFTFNPTD